MAWNTSRVRGLTPPWTARYGREFKGAKIPFGAHVKFMPNLPAKKDPNKLPFQTRTEDGIFMGYHLSSEGEWKGDYYVMSHEMARGMFLYREVPPSRLMQPKRVGRIYTVGGPATFPLKAHFDSINQSIGKEGGRFGMDVPTPAPTVAEPY